MKFLTRKDIAAALEVSTDTVRRNEKRWGLRPLKWSRKTVRFDAKESKAALERALCVSLPI